MTEQPNVSLKQLKSHLKDALKKSGVVDNVKAQIRKEFIANLATENGSMKSQKNFSLRDRAIFSVIYHSLRKKGFAHTLSVFAAECGFDRSPALTEPDIVQALQY